MSAEVVIRAEWIHDRVALLEVPFWDQLSVALYLVEGERRLLIDTGGPDTPERALKPALAQIDRQLSDIDVIVNTHAHMEHAWGNGAILASTPADVLMHAAEVPFLDPLTHFESVVRYYSTLGPPSEKELAQQEAQRQQAATSPPHAPAPHRTVRDGDLIDLGRGVELRVLHTPGHSPGSICLHWEEDQILFTGDSVTGSADSRWFYFEDARSHRNSLERLQQLPVQVVCPAHRYSYRPPDGTVTDPIRWDTDAKRFLADSLLTALDLESCAVEALHAHPTASRRTQAEAALTRLARRLGSTVPTDVPWPQLAAALWLRELSGQA